MILATSDDYELPHCDWHCKRCGMVYVSSGYPDETRCADGHGFGWEIDKSQHEEYVDFLESLSVGDGVVFVGRGPAPLMGPVAETGDSYIITESIDSSARKIRWGGSKEDSYSDYSIEHSRTDRTHPLWQDVHHVEGVEISGDLS